MASYTNFAVRLPRLPEEMPSQYGAHDPDLKIPARKSTHLLRRGRSAPYLPSLARIHPPTESLSSSALFSQLLLPSDVISLGNGDPDLSALSRTQSPLRLGSGNSELKDTNISLTTAVSKPATARKTFPRSPGLLTRDSWGSPAFRNLLKSLEKPSWDQGILLNHKGRVPEPKTTVSYKVPSWQPTPPREPTINCLEGSLRSVPMNCAEATCIPLVIVDPSIKKARDDDSFRDESAVIFVNGEESVVFRRPDDSFTMVKNSSEYGHPVRLASLVRDLEDTDNTNDSMMGLVLDDRDGFMKYSNLTNDPELKKLADPTKNQDLSKFPILMKNQDAKKLPDLTKNQDTKKIPDPMKFQDLKKFLDLIKHQNPKIPDPTKHQNLKKIPDLMKTQDTAKLPDPRKNQDPSNFPDPPKHQDSMKNNQDMKFSDTKKIPDPSKHQDPKKFLDLLEDDFGGLTKNPLLDVHNDLTIHALQDGRCGVTTHSDLTKSPEPEILTTYPDLPSPTCLMEPWQEPPCLMATSTSPLRDQVVEVQETMALLPGLPPMLSAEEDYLAPAFDQDQVAEMPPPLLMPTAFIKQEAVERESSMSPEMPYLSPADYVDVEYNMGFQPFSLPSDAPPLRMFGNRDGRFQRRRPRRRGVPLGFKRQCPQRNTNTEAYFQGRYAFMAGKKIRDPDYKRGAGPVKRGTGRGPGRPPLHGVGRRIRRPGRPRVRRRGYHSASNRMRCPDPHVDVIDGVEFLSFECEEDLARFMKTHPSYTLDVSKIPLEDAELFRFPADVGRRGPRVRGEPIVLTKTDDVTKIKGWRCKVFAATGLNDFANEYAIAESKRMRFVERYMSAGPVVSGYRGPGTFAADREDAPQKGQVREVGAAVDAPIPMEDAPRGSGEIPSMPESVAETWKSGFVAKSLKSGFVTDSSKSGFAAESSESLSVAESPMPLSKADSFLMEASGSSMIPESNNSEQLPVITEVTGSATNTKSAFVSDFLDEFLRTSSELKIGAAATLVGESKQKDGEEICTKVVWPTRDVYRVPTPEVDNSPFDGNYPFNLVSPVKARRMPALKKTSFGKQEADRVKRKYTRRVPLKPIAETATKTTAEEFMTVKRKYVRRAPVSPTKIFGALNEPKTSNRIRATNEFGAVNKAKVCLPIPSYLRTDRKAVLTAPTNKVTIDPVIMSSSDVQFALAALVAPGFWHKTVDTLPPLEAIGRMCKEVKDLPDAGRDKELMRRRFSVVMDRDHVDHALRALDPRHGGSYDKAPASPDFLSKEFHALSAEEKWEKMMNIPVDNTDPFPILGDIDPGGLIKGSPPKPMSNRQHLQRDIERPPGYLRNLLLHDEYKAAASPNPNPAERSPLKPLSDRVQHRNARGLPKSKPGNGFTLTGTWGNTTTAAAVAAKKSGETLPKQTAKGPKVPVRPKQVTVGGAAKKSPTSASEAPPMAAAEPAVNAGRCAEPHCQLGCVCSSLRAVKKRRKHCGRAQCMLACNCKEMDAMQARPEEEEPATPEKEEEKEVAPPPPKRRSREIRLPARLKDSVCLWNQAWVSVSANDEDYCQNPPAKKKPRGRYKVKGNKDDFPLPLVRNPPSKPVPDRIKHLYSQRPVLVHRPTPASDDDDDDEESSSPDIINSNNQGARKQFMACKSNSARKSFLAGRLSDAAGAARKGPCAGAIRTDAHQQPQPQTLLPPTRRLLYNPDGSVAGVLRTAPTTREVTLETSPPPLTKTARKSVSAPLPWVSNRRKAMEQMAALKTNVPDVRGSAGGGIVISDVRGSAKDFVVPDGNGYVRDVVRDVLDELLWKVSVNVDGTQRAARARMSWKKPGPQRSLVQLKECDGVTAAVPEASAKDDETVAAAAAGSECARRGSDKQRRRMALRKGLRQLGAMLEPIGAASKRDRKRESVVRYHTVDMARTAINQLRWDHRSLIIAKTALIKQRGKLFKTFAALLEDVSAGERMDAVEDLAEDIQTLAQRREMPGPQSLRVLELYTMPAGVSLTTVERVDLDLALFARWDKTEDLAPDEDDSDLSETDIDVAFKRMSDSQDYDFENEEEGMTADSDNADKRPKPIHDRVNGVSRPLTSLVAVSNKTTAPASIQPRQPSGGPLWFPLHRTAERWQPGKVRPRKTGEVFGPIRTFKISTGPSARGLKVLEATKTNAAIPMQSLLVGPFERPRILQRAKPKVIVAAAASSAEDCAVGGAAVVPKAATESVDSASRGRTIKLKAADSAGAAAAVAALDKFVYCSATRTFRPLTFSDLVLKPGVRGAPPTIRIALNPAGGVQHLCSMPTNVPATMDSAVAAGTTAIKSLLMSGKDAGKVIQGSPSVASGVKNPLLSAATGTVLQGIPLCVKKSNSRSILHGNPSATSGTVFQVSPNNSGMVLSQGTPSTSKNLTSGTILQGNLSSASGTVLQQTPATASGSVLQGNPLATSGTVRQQVSPSTNSGSVLQGSSSTAKNLTSVTVLQGNQSATSGAVLQVSPSTNSGTILQGIPTVTTSTPSTVKNPSEVSLQDASDLPAATLNNARFATGPPHGNFSQVAPAKPAPAPDSRPLFVMPSSFTANSKTTNPMTQATIDFNGKNVPFFCTLSKSATATNKPASKVGAPPTIMIGMVSSNPATGTTNSATTVNAPVGSNLMTIQLPPNTMSITLDGKKLCFLKPGTRLVPKNAVPIRASATATTTTAAGSTATTTAPRYLRPILPLEKFKFIAANARPKGLVVLKPKPAPPTDIKGPQESPRDVSAIAAAGEAIGPKMDVPAGKVSEDVLDIGAAATVSAVKTYATADTVSSTTEDDLTAAATAVTKASGHWEMVRNVGGDKCAELSIRTVEGADGSPPGNPFGPSADSPDTTTGEGAANRMDETVRDVEGDATDPTKSVNSDVEIIDILKEYHETVARVCQSQQSVAASGQSGPFVGLTPKIAATTRNPEEEEDEEEEDSASASAAARNPENPDPAAKNPATTQIVEVTVDNLKSFIEIPAGCTVTSAVLNPDKPGIPSGLTLAPRILNPEESSKIPPGRTLRPLLPKIPDPEESGKIPTGRMFRPLLPKLLDPGILAGLAMMPRIPDPEEFGKISAGRMLRPRTQNPEKPPPDESVAGRISSSVPGILSPGIPADCTSTTMILNPGEPGIPLDCAIVPDPVGPGILAVDLATALRISDPDEVARIPTGRTLRPRIPNPDKPGIPSDSAKTPRIPKPVEAVLKLNEDCTMTAKTLGGYALRPRISIPDKSGISSHCAILDLDNPEIPAGCAMTSRISHSDDPAKIPAGCAVMTGIPNPVDPEKIPASYTLRPRISNHDNPGIPVDSAMTSKGIPDPDETRKIPSDCTLTPRISDLRITADRALAKRISDPGESVPFWNLDSSLEEEFEPDGRSSPDVLIIDTERPVDESRDPSTSVSRTAVAGIPSGCTLTPRIPEESEWDARSCSPDVVFLDAAAAAATATAIASSAVEETSSRQVEPEDQHEKLLASLKELTVVRLPPKTPTLPQTDVRFSGTDVRLSGTDVRLTETSEVEWPKIIAFTSISEDEFLCEQVAGSANQFPLSVDDELPVG